MNSGALPRTTRHPDPPPQGARNGEEKGRVRPVCCSLFPLDAGGLKWGVSCAPGPRFIHNL